MTQNTQIFNHLKRYGSITPGYALDKFDCMRLAARISELRGRGHKIETDWIKRNGKRFAKYRYYSNG